MRCKQCRHYHWYVAIINGRPIGYAWNIPCTTCSRFSVTQDNFEPNRSVNDLEPKTRPARQLSLRNTQLSQDGEPEP